MHKHFIVFCRTEIQYRLQYFIFYFDQAQGLVHCFLILTSYNCSRISHKAHSLIQDQPVIGAWLRIGLSGHCKSLIGHIFVSIDHLNSRNLHGNIRINFLNKGMSIGTVQYLHHKAVSGSNVVGINRLPRHKSHSVFLSHRLIYIAAIHSWHFIRHYASPPFS